MATTSVTTGVTKPKLLIRGFCLSNSYLIENEGASTSIDLESPWTLIFAENNGTSKKALLEALNHSICAALRSNGSIEGNSLSEILCPTDSKDVKSEYVIINGMSIELLNQGMFSHEEETYWPLQNGSSKQRKIFDAIFKRPPTMINTTLMDVSKAIEKEIEVSKENALQVFENYQQYRYFKYSQKIWSGILKQQVLKVQFASDHLKRLELRMAYVNTKQERCQKFEDVIAKLTEKVSVCEAEVNNLQTSIETTDPDSYDMKEDMNSLMEMEYIDWRFVNFQEKAHISLLRQKISWSYLLKQCSLEDDEDNHRDGLAACQALAKCISNDIPSNLDEFSCDSYQRKILSVADDIIKQYSEAKENEDRNKLKITEIESEMKNTQEKMYKIEKAIEFSQQKLATLLEAEANVRLQSIAEEGHHCSNMKCLNGALSQVSTKIAARKYTMAKWAYKKSSPHKMRWQKGRHNFVKRPEQKCSERLTKAFPSVSLVAKKRREFRRILRLRIQQQIAEIRMQKLGVQNLKISYENTLSSTKAELKVQVARTISEKNTMALLNKELNELKLEHATLHADSLKLQSQTPHLYRQYVYSDLLKSLLEPALKMCSIRKVVEMHIGNAKRLLDNVCSQTTQEEFELSNLILELKNSQNLFERNWSTKFSLRMKEIELLKLRATLKFETEKFNTLTENIKRRSTELLQEYKMVAHSVHGDRIELRQVSEMVASKEENLGKLVILGAAKEYSERQRIILDLENDLCKIKQRIKTNEDSYSIFQSTKIKEINANIRLLLVGIEPAGIYSMHGFKCEIKIVEPSTPSDNNNYRVELMKNQQPFCLEAGLCSGELKPFFSVLSLIIRMAAFQTFVTECRTFIFNESVASWNDKEKYQLAACLRALLESISENKNHSPLKLIVITDDLEFLKLLKRRNGNVYIHRVSINSGALSQLQNQKMQTD